MPRASKIIIDLVEIRVRQEVSRLGGGGSAARWLDELDSLFRVCQEFLVGWLGQDSEVLLRTGHVLAIFGLSRLLTIV